MSRRIYNTQRGTKALELEKMGMVRRQRKFRWHTLASDAWSYDFVMTNRNNIYRNQETLKFKKIVINHYSDGRNRCECCWESEIGLLTIDHINGREGFNHTKKIGGKWFYRWIIKNNFPKGLQVLCYNCNFGKKSFGICPHQTRFCA
jgi:hypothetical protein